MQRLKLCAGIVSIELWCPQIVHPHIFYTGGEVMSTLKTYGDAVVSIFKLIGDKENDITKSIAGALNKYPVFMEKVIYEVFT